MKTTVALILACLASSAAMAATLKLSGVLPAGVKITGVSAEYAPNSGTYGCMGASSVPGSVRIQGNAFQASINYQARIGGMFCKKELKRVRLSYEVSRVENGVIFPDHTFAGHALSFGKTATAPLRLASLKVTCARSAVGSTDGAYNVTFTSGQAACVADKKLNLPLSGISEVKGITFNVLPLPPANVDPAHLAAVHEFTQDGLKVELYNNAHGVVGPMSVLRVVQAPAGAALRVGRYRVDTVLTATGSGDLLKVEGSGSYVGQTTPFTFVFSPRNNDPRLRDRRVEWNALKCSGADSLALMVVGHKIHCSR
jgi:hypothetical protein